MKTAKIPNPSILPTEVQLLHVEYGTLYPTAEAVSKRMLGIERKEAVSAMIRNGEFPIPVKKLNHSQKAPWIVTLTDLAIYIQNLESA
ncbi:pyocin activator PrtN family protein [Thiolinea disciformis]|uniref:pyocin activator PrtN family protein n=1 Tax=Thiolinea disciformis TaxID=125614 RepID=UPI000382EC9B|nr:pyocin activator PrtN family protein [Thiolinea disciformis]